MRIIPLGGAQEVGASSTIVEFGSYRFLVDAGIRIGAKDGDQLPALDRIKDDAGPIDAILLTHAHIDHSGALPLVHLAFPEAPIFMTPATYAVVRILFSDSLRLMEGRYQTEGEIPLYPPAAVESCLGCIRPIPFDYPLRLAGGDVSATFHPAGHILGASSISLHGRSGSILLSGDISVTDQRTVPGMLPPRASHDVIMIESTYGDRLHAHRPTQEAHLIRTVADIIGNGGKIVIPSFAVGRAQEVILILRHAMAKGEIPRFPIYVDGMVQAVCDTYSRFPTYLQQHLRRSVQNGDNPFFPSGGPIHRVRNREQREEILDGPACCIIASSGMMTGGPSAYYASNLADDPRNLIAITGYQDEEAPGRRLIDLLAAPQGDRHLRLADRDVEIRCRVEKYALSAHADSGEIAGLVGQMAPEQGVVLVHGDEEARTSLANVIDGLIPGKVYLPSNGQPILFRAPRRAFAPPRDSFQDISARSPAIAAPAQPLNAPALSHLHQALWAETGRRGLYRIADLYARWYGPTSIPSPEEIQILHDLLRSAPSLFESDKRRPHLYRLCSPHESPSAPTSSAPRSSSTLPLEMNHALHLIDLKFPSEAGLYKKGARQEERTLLLFFRFPQCAARKYKDELHALSQETGWLIALNDIPHHAALEETARRLLPESWILAKNPSILHENQAVRLRIFRPLLSPSSLQDALLASQARFLDETGYALEIQLQDPLPSAQDAIPLPPASEALEINQAYQRIDEAFASLPHRPYKKSKKGAEIVLSFLSPLIGEQYRSRLDALSRSIGWPLLINPEPNPYGIKQEIRTLLPPSWILKREPSFLKKETVVRIQLLSSPSPQQLESIVREVFFRTGFRLEVTSDVRPFESQNP